MKQYKVIFKDIWQMRKFVSLIADYPFKISLYADDYKIDAKSIMGVYSLSTSRPLQLETSTDDVGDFEEKIKEFLVR